MSDDDRIAEILAEWYERKEGGQAADPGDVIRAHPDVARELTAHIAAQAVFDEVVAPASTAPRRIGEYERNARRFPDDFAFRLSHEEARHFAPTGPTPGPGDGSQTVTGSQKHRDPRFRPWAFTEHGALMAANVLRSDRALQMVSVYVVRAFVRMRACLEGNAEILRRLAEIDATLLEHDSALREIWESLQPLLAPPREPPQRRIGFHVKDRAALPGERAAPDPS